VLIIFSFDKNQLWISSSNFLRLTNASKSVDGLENVSRRAKPFETAFFFYHSSPKKSNPKGGVKKRDIHKKLKNSNS